MLAAVADHRTLDHDEEQQKGSCGDLAPPGIQMPVKGNQSRNDRLQKDTKHGTDHETDTAGQQGSADNRAGDDLQLTSLQCHIPAGLDDQQISDAGQSGAEAVEGIDGDFDPADGKTHQAGALFIAAHSVDIPAKPGVLQNDRADDDHDDKDHHVQTDRGNRFDFDPLPISIFVKRKLDSGQLIDQRMIDTDRLTGDQTAHTSGQEVAGQGGDKGRHVQVVDGRAHEGTQAYRHQDGEGNGDQRRNPQLRIAVGDKHAGQGLYRSHGQIDPPRDQNHGHTHGRDPVIRIVRKEIDKGTQRREADTAIHDGTEDIDDQENSNRRVDHDIFRIHDPAEQALAGRDSLLFHLFSPPFNAALRRVRLDIQLRTGSDWSTITMAMIKALKAMVASAAMPK